MVWIILLVVVVLLALYAIASYNGCMLHHEAGCGDRVTGYGLRVTGIGVTRQR